MTVYKKSSYTTVETIASIDRLVTMYVESLSDPKAIGNFYSALLRYALPALGFPAPNESRLDKSTRAKYLDMLNSLSVMSLEDLPTRLEEYFLRINLSRSSCRPIRSRVNNFYGFFAEKCLNLEEKTIQRASSGEIRFYRKNYNHSLRKIRTTDRDLVRHVDYQALDPKLYARFNKEVAKLENFVEKVLKVKRIEGEFKNVKKLVTLICWFHQVHNRELTFASIVKYIPLKATSKTKLKGKTIHEYEATQLILCREHSHKVVEDLNLFFDSMEMPIKASSKNAYIRALINLGKYLYQKDTDICFYNKFEDIPIVQRLKSYSRTFQRDAEVETGNQIIDGKMITWNEVKKVIERSRLLAKQTRYQGRAKIASTAKFTDYKRFLIGSLLTIMPPGRQHVFRELVYGKTIVYGLFDEFNQFTEHTKLKKNQTPIWYISLVPIEYKTGRTHKSWIVEIPNRKYSDGDEFYDYLHQWYFKYDRDEDGNWYSLREAIKPLDDSFFPGSKTRKMSSASCMTSFMKNVFYQATDTPLTPHTLRHIFNTHVRNLGASEAVLESLGYWMQHKKETADKHYNQQNIRERFKIGWDFVKDII